MPITTSGDFILVDAIIISLSPFGIFTVKKLHELNFYIPKTDGREARGAL